MNELQIFSNPEFGDMRTLSIDWEPWMVGKDVAQEIHDKGICLEEYLEIQQ